jgi:hypothetical protein
MQPKESKTNYHFYFSVTKSLIRILASVQLCCGNLSVSGIMFGVAEVLGIIEEF